MRAKQPVWVVMLVAAVGGAVLAGEPGVKDRHPVYVGVDACRKCHVGQAMGHQFSRWRASGHARAYAVLWSPEARRIAKLSGIPEEPTQAAVCLGCHATAADAESWEKEESVRLADGVQCERCHGPGSEYADCEIMQDRERAMAAGLKPAGEQTCMICHKVKGSHVAVLGSPEFDVKAALKQIAHAVPNKEEFPKRDPCGGQVRRIAPPVPQDSSTGKMPVPQASSSGKMPVPQASLPSVEHQYVGVAKCGECHQGPMMGYQYRRWRASGHAGAFAVLGTPAGYRIAADEGVQGDPQVSSKCLRCHTTEGWLHAEYFAPSFDYVDGVQCEACHGPGSDYAVEAVMRDAPAARAAGLREVTEATCLPCHEDAHGHEFDYERMLAKIAHPTKLPQPAAEAHYKTPLNMALSPDGRELYVACEASDTVVVVDVERRAVVAEIHTGGQPTDVTFSPSGEWAYVTNRLDDTLAVVDVRRRSVVATIAVGDEPHGVVTDAAGRLIYVLNTSSDSISVIDADALVEVKRLAASRGPWSLALSPDGRRIVVTNTLSRFVKFREPSLSELTIIDAERGVVESRVEVPAVNLMQGVAWHPSGKFALITLNRTKNLVPMTRLLQGWTITNGFGVVWPDGRVDQLLLDEPDMSFPDAADVAVSPDGRYALVTSSGSDRLAVVAVDKLIALLESASDYEREHVFPNHLGKPTEFVVKHIRTHDSPRGIVFAPDGRTAFVANALDDSLTVIDMDKLDAVARIDLGGSPQITKVRFGERLFHSANITFHRQFSCHSCHPDGHVDGLTYDIEPDGIGLSPVDNRTLRGILDTAPFKWEGTNPSLQRQCGPRLAVFFTRIDPFTPEELSALDNYICTIPRPPNRYRPVGGELSAAQRRGQALFERMMTNDGRTIPVDRRCVSCHCPPYYTDRTRRNVGTRMWLDREVDFDVPHLSNIYDSAPYLHNGIAQTLEQIWTDHNPYDQHGVTNDMTKDQLNDLCEYLKTL